MNDIGVIIAGGTGFGAGELLRLLTQHPNTKVVAVTSQSSAGKSIIAAHPHLNGFYDLKFIEKFDASLLNGFKHKILFVTQPHGASAEFIESVFAECKKSSVKIIDLSGDLRLKDLAIHAEYYPTSKQAKELRSKAVYGLSEFYREQIASAEIVSNPGCLATAAIFALAPLAQLGCKGDVVANLTTGSSGAGRALKESTHHPLRHANAFAYKMLNHQHQPEILQALGETTSWTPSLSLVAHSLPISRGILGTIYATLEKPISSNQLQKSLEDLYAKSAFVRVLPYGSSVELNNVVASNFTDISITANKDKVVITVALDNLVKGMAGQAIQNMNIMCNLDETAGLRTPALRVV